MKPQSYFIVASLRNVYGKNSTTSLSFCPSSRQLLLHSSTTRHPWRNVLCQQLHSLLCAYWHALKTKKNTPLIVKFITCAFLSLFLSACDIELDSTKTTDNTDENTGIVSGEVPVASTITTEPASSYYALRPTDDKWPTYTEENSVSENLLAANYYIVLDGSGSMEGDNCAIGSTKMKIAKKAINQFAQQIPTDANLALLAFDKKGASQRIALGRNNREQFKQQVNAILPGSVTPLKSAITYAYQKLKKQAVNQLGYGEYHLVVVTDGIATASEIPDRIVQAILQDSPVVIHSIGFCIDEKHSLNQPGRTFYTAASNAEELQRGLQAVLAEAPDFNSDHF